MAAVDPRPVASVVDEDVAAIAGAAGPEAADPVLDDHAGETHGGDGTDPGCHGGVQGLVVEMGIAVVHRDTWRRAVLLEDPVQSGYCCADVRGGENPPQVIAESVKLSEVLLSHRLRIGREERLVMSQEALQFVNCRDLVTRELIGVDEVHRKFHGLIRVMREIHLTYYTPSNMVTSVRMNGYYVKRRFPS